MDRSNIILVFQAETHEYRITRSTSTTSITSVYPVNKIRATLNHTLVHQFLERLVLARVTTIIQELVPETGIDQVTSCMLCTTHIEIHIAPVFINVLVNQGILVLRIHIAQIVGTGSSKTRHGVQLQGEDGLVVDELF